MGILEGGAAVLCLAPRHLGSIFDQSRLWRGAPELGGPFQRIRSWHRLVFDGLLELGNLLRNITSCLQSCDIAYICWEAGTLSM